MTILDYYQNQLQPVFSVELQSEYIKLPVLQSLSAFRYYSLVNHGKNPQDWKNLLDTASKIQAETKRVVLMHLPLDQLDAPGLSNSLVQVTAHDINQLLVIRGDGWRATSHFHDTAQVLTEIGILAPNIILFATIDLGKIQTVGLDSVVAEAHAKFIAGARVLITQLFFDETLFYCLRRALDIAGIAVILVAGIMPLSRLSQLTWVEQRLHIKVPSALKDAIVTNQLATVDTYWHRKIRNLTAHRVAGIHFFSGTDWCAIESWITADD